MNKLGMSPSEHLMNLQGDASNSIFHQFESAGAYKSQINTSSGSWMWKCTKGGRVDLRVRPISPRSVHNIPIRKYVADVNHKRGVQKEDGEVQISGPSGNVFD